MQSVIIYYSDSWPWLPALCGPVPKLDLQCFFPDSGSCSSYYCYIISWLLLSSPSTTHCFFDIPSRHPFLISYPWKWPSHYLCSAGMEPWTCLWLMACLQLHLRNQSLSPFSSTWKCFFPLFSLCFHQFPLLSYYWSFQTDVRGSSLSYSCLLSHWSQLNLTKTLRSWRIPTAQQYSEILPCHLIALLWSSKALITGPIVSI